MNALIVFSAVVAACSGAEILGLNAALPYNAAPLAYAGAAPLAYAGAPLAAAPAPLPAALAAPSSQFQAQDEAGNINYGYSNINSAKQEAGNTYGGVTGSYSYVDAYGIPQRVDYIADGLGFRVKATNLPVAPAVPAVTPLITPVAPVFEGVAPAPVEDTPEVAAAKAEFRAAFDAAVATAAPAPEEEEKREKRSAPVAYTPTALTAFGFPGYAAGYAYGAAPFAGAYAAPLAGAYAAPLAGAYAAPAAVAAPAAAIAAPATREAILTKIKLNPGHALFYRVD